MSSRQTAQPYRRTKYIRAPEVANSTARFANIARRREFVFRLRRNKSRAKYTRKKMQNRAANQTAKSLPPNARAAANTNTATIPKQKPPRPPPPFCRPETAACQRTTAQKTAQPTNTTANDSPIPRPPAKTKAATNCDSARAQFAKQPQKSPPSKTHSAHILRE